MDLSLVVYSQNRGTHLVTTVALAGSSATFWSTAMKKPPVSMWCGSTRTQRSRCRSPASSGNMVLHSRPCVSLCKHLWSQYWPDSLDNILRRRWSLSTQGADHQRPLKTWSYTAAHASPSASTHDPSEVPDSLDHVLRRRHCHCGKLKLV